MKSSISRAFFLIFLFCLTWHLNPFAVCPTPEVVEKLRKEGKLEEWVNRWESAAKRGMYEITPGTYIRSKDKNFGDVDTLKPLVLCVDFSDNPHTYNSGKFDTLLFSKDFTFPTGSFRDYYLENSYGQHDPQGGVYGWVIAPQTYHYYTWGQNGTGYYPHNAQKLVEDALLAADPYVDYSDYDYDGNGWIDGLMVVHAGPGAEETGSDDDIWSHRFVLHSTMTLDGTSIYDYTIQPEEHSSGGLIDIGVFCHEWGHFIGVNWEEYDRDYSSWGLGDWSVMATGCYNGRPGHAGESPAHHSAYCKYYLGWSDVINVQSNQTNVEIIQAETSPVSYRLWTSGSGGNQFFMVENRQKTGFDSYLPGSGLLIYHVDVGMSSDNNLEWCPGDPPTPHYKTALEQADGNFDIEGCYGDSTQGDRYDPFPGYSDKRAFDDTTTPSSRDYYDDATQVAVWDISNSDSVMYANLDVTWSRPCLFLDEFTLDDSPPGGDGDGKPEAGETVKLYFTISNIWLPINNTTVTGSVDTTAITFTDDYSYLGYIGTGGSANNSSDPMEFVVDPDLPGRPTIFTLQVEGNDGSYTLDFDVEVQAGNTEILIVDDAGAYQSYYTSALDSLKQIYDIWEAYSKGDPDFSFSEYKYLIWYTGDHQTDLFTKAQVESLMSFLDSGGRLFLTSQDAVEVLSGSVNPWDQTFLADYLHVGYDGNSDKYLVIGRPEDELGEDLYIFPNYEVNNQDSKDNLVPDSEADSVLLYTVGGAGQWWAPSDLVAGTKFQNDFFKVVVFGFGFESIRADGGLSHGQYCSKPHFVMERVLSWLRGTSDVFDWGEEFANLPEAIHLYQNYPNPFNAVTSIQYAVGSRQTKAVDGSPFMVHSPPIPTLTVSRKAADGEKAVDGSQFMVHRPVHTTLKIYNIRGQLVRTLLDEEKQPGIHSVIWDGKDQKGHEVSSGIYFYQLKAKDHSEVRKMILLK
jgi:M6 family metalloprotease-like protein